MKSLVTIEKNEPLTDSLIIADGIESDHRSVYRTIKRYQSDLEEFGIVRFQIALTGKRGMPKKYAILNEEQTTFLIMLMKNQPKVIEFKKKITKEFFKMRKALARIATQKQNAEWIEARKNGITMRKEETDVIQAFVEYAMNQGSKHAKTYYMNITKMENKALFKVNGKYSNLRNVLNYTQLTAVQHADRLVKEALIEGMNSNLYYKDIYTLAKSKVTKLGDALGTSIVPVGLTDGTQTLSISA